MAEKKKNIKPIIILGVVLVAGLIGFLVYDEVKTANYKKELNLAIQNTYELESGSCVGQTYNFKKETPEEKKRDSASGKLCPHRRWLDFPRKHRQ